MHVFDRDEEITAVPEIHYLEEILARISSGELRVPRFQRPFAWGPEQMLDLFDSIERGIPSGAFSSGRPIGKSPAWMRSPA
ncbi:hypothetical protein Acor_30640 [Acrocarpospora corrugata]|uniref:GmrSD restriction endonucleases N-terminal domain-containing protein n=1 Tax=Acrocarpospora corrugata TaxID=35763 RepID=A0A5M3VYI2_9ACTN|nr:DUF262 domain-containing protein [Acrocarpospora corrugata]GES01000.1 hypothetical protein Acor_30640 [Acrocarpospora corrugata]